MAINTELLINEYNELVGEWNKALYELGQEFTNMPRYPYLRDRMEEIKEILKLNEMANKIKTVREARKYISKYKKDILRTFGNKCEVCKFDFSPSLVVHHRIPLKDGGNNDFSNLSVLCPTCHHLVHYLRSNENNDENKNIKRQLTNVVAEIMPILKEA